MYLCREEPPMLEEIYKKYKDKGFLIVDFNCKGDKQIVLNLFRGN